ncbi:MAG: autotransporter-associated beta strand repeat-containing protein [Chthoniobacterales bacterium]|nr:autotransporter-associated beta strand repeat-containing protein [Chthoniobacterales bacterium]
MFTKGESAWSGMQENSSGAFSGSISYTGNSDHQITISRDLILSQYTPDLVDFGNVAISADLLSIRFTNGILSATAISGGGGSGGAYSGPWNWTAGSGNWDATNNWTSNQVASNGYAAWITGVAGGGTITNNGVSSLSSLTFSNGAGSFTLTGTNPGQTLTISSGINNNSSNTQTIDLSIAGAGGVTQSGSGTTVLVKSNSYVGGTTLNNGAVVIGNNNALGSGAVTVTGASSLIAGVANLSTTNDMVLNAATTINTEANRWTNAGTLSGLGSLTKTGSATLTLSGTSASYSGASTINAGAMQVTGNLGTGTVTVSNGASLSGSGRVGGITVASGGAVMAGSDTAIGTLTVTGNGIWSGGGIYNWKISDASENEGVGYDLISIGGALDLSGVTSLNKFQINLWSLGGNAANFNQDIDGAWKIASFSSLNGSFSTNLFSVNLGATNGTGGFPNATNGTFSLSSSVDALFLQYKTRAATETSGIWSAGSGNLTGITNGSLLQFTGVGGSVTNQSVTDLTGISYGSLAGGYTLSGTNITLSGNVTNASSSQQNISSRINLATNAAITAQNGAMQLAGAVALDSNNLTISGDRQTTLAGDIAGSGTLIKQGAGTLVLSGVSSNAGGLAVESGRAILSGGDDRLSSNGRLSVSSDAVVDLGTNSQRFVALSGSGTITGGSGSITFAPSNAISYAGTIGGQKAVVQNGSGTTTLTGSNSYTGGTIVFAGTLVAGSSNALGANLSPVSVRGGTLDLGGGTRTMGSVTLTAGEISNGSITANLMACVASGQQATISATLAGNRGFWKLGAGTLNLLSAMPTGTNIVMSGALKTSGSVMGVASNALGKIILGGTSSPALWTNEGNLTLATNGKTILELRDAATLRTGDLTLAAAKSSQGTLLLTGTGTNGGTTIEVGSGTITFGAGAGKIDYKKSSSSTLSQALSGKGMVTVSGMGTLTLAGNNSGFAGTNYLTSGGMVIGANTLNGGVALVSGKKSTLTLQQGASLSSTNALHAVGGKLIDNSGLAFTNSIRSSRIVTNGALRPGILLATGGTLEKSYTATNDVTRNVAGFGAGYGSGKSFQILSGAVAGASTLTALSDANGRLDLHGTGSNPFVMAMTDASFTATRNQIQWLYTNSATPYWTNTIAGNIQGSNKTAAISGMNGLSFAGSFNSFLLQTSLKTAGITSDPSDTLVELNDLGTDSIAGLLNKIMGAYGYDSATKTAWAVINHNSLFDSQPGIDTDPGLAPLDMGASSVTTQTVPEPGTWALMIIGSVALLFAIKAKNRKKI